MIHSALFIYETLSVVRLYVTLEYFSKCLYRRSKLTVGTLYVTSFTLTTESFVVFSLIISFHRLRLH